MKSSNNLSLWDKSKLTLRYLGVGVWAYWSKYELHSYNKTRERPYPHQEAQASNCWCHKPQHHRRVCLPGQKHSTRNMAITITNSTVTPSSLRTKDTQLWKVTINGYHAMATPMCCRLGNHGTCRHCGYWLPLVKALKKFHFCAYLEPKPNQQPRRYPIFCLNKEVMLCETHPIPNRNYCIRCQCKDTGNRKNKEP